MTASSLTLTTLRARVQGELADTGANIWSTDDLDIAIRRALIEYSRQARAFQAITTVEFGSATRELDISAVTGLIDIERVWLPYTAADPEEPPNWRLFEYWEDSQLLYFPDGDRPADGDIARLFYTKMQTLNGLDSAASTTFSVEHEDLLIVGAAGHAAVQRGMDAAEEVTLDRNTSAVVQAWGQGRLSEFRYGMFFIKRSRGLEGQSHIELPALDRWDARLGYSRSRWS